MSKIRYDRGVANGMRGLGDCKSAPFNVSNDKWESIFGKKKKVVSGTHTDVVIEKYSNKPTESNTGDQNGD